MTPDRTDTTDCACIEAAATRSKTACRLNMGKLSAISMGANLALVNRGDAIPVHWKRHVVEGEHFAPGSDRDAGGGMGESRACSRTRHAFCRGTALCRPEPAAERRRRDSPVAGNRRI